MSKKDQAEDLMDKTVDEEIAGDLSKIINKLSKSEFKKEAILILNMLGYLCSNNIPTKMFLLLTKDEKIIKASINLLRENSIVNLNVDKNILNIDQKNQIAIRSLCQIDEKEVSCLCELILLIFDYTIDGFWNDNLYIEHGLEVWKHVSKYNQLVALSDLLPYYILEKLRTTLRYSEADKFGRSAYETLKRACGEDQPGTLKLRLEYAMLLNDMGKYNDALHILKPIMAKNYSHWHDEDQVEIILNLAKQYSELNLYEESESIFKNILSRFIMVLENDEELFLDVFVTYSKFNDSLKILKKALEKKVATTL